MTSLGLSCLVLLEASFRAVTESLGCGVGLETLIPTPPLVWGGLGKLLDLHSLTCRMRTDTHFIGPL